MLHHISRPTASIQNLEVPQLLYGQGLSGGEDATRLSGVLVVHAETGSSFNHKRRSLTSTKRPFPVVAECTTESLHANKNGVLMGQCLSPCGSFEETSNRTAEYVTPLLFLLGKGSFLPGTLTTGGRRTVSSARAMCHNVLSSSKTYCSSCSI